MSREQVLIVLDTLLEYPALADYIRTFNGINGFAYTQETNPIKIQLKEQLNKLDDGSHSGASFACMMRAVQSVLNGLQTRENL
jgi:hypothetical protein